MPKEIKIASADELKAFANAIGEGIACGATIEVVEVVIETVQPATEQMVDSVQKFKEEMKQNLGYIVAAKDEF